MNGLAKVVVPELNVEHVRAFIINHLSSTNLLRAADPAESAPDHTFMSNEQFWQALLSYHAAPLSRIELPGFHLCDWFPRSPGLYYTEEAQYQREIAQNHLVDDNGVLHYRPEGKSNMIAGGVGSVRFQPIPLESGDHWLCTATSDHYCHTGIPLAVPDELMKGVYFRESGQFNIKGQLRFLPPFLDKYFGHYTRVRQLYLHVSDLKRTSGRGSPITVTPMVFFEAEGEYRTEHRVTYVLCSSLNDLELDIAADWISGYVEQYGKTILTNFDQQRPTFAHVPFSLQAVMSNQVETSAIEAVYINNAEIVNSEIGKIFTERADMSTNISVTLGDGTIIHGDMVVANSIKDSFNRAVNADSPDDLKQTLKDLSVAVGKLTENLGKEAASEVARDLEALTSEATSTNPRKKWWQLSMDGITSAAERAADLGKPVLDILAKLTPLLIATAG